MPTSITDYNLSTGMAPATRPLHPRPPADMLSLVVEAMSHHLARHPHPADFRISLDIELMFGPITGSWLATFEHTYSLRGIAA